MYKVKLLNNISPIVNEVLDKDYEISEDVNQPDALFVRASDLHEYNFDESIKCIGRAGIGVNTIPLDKCSEKGIVVFNTPGGNANGVKEIFLFGLMMSNRKLKEAMDWIDNYNEDLPIEVRMEKIKKQFAGPEVIGKTIGVIGTGNVGSLVANICLDLGMKVYGYDPYLSVDAAWKVSRHVKRVNDINELWDKCDYITLHTPLTDETRNMINKDTLSKMKNNIRIINYARGEVVNEEDIIEALNSNKVACYVSDFPTKKLCAQPKVVLTPHLGGTTQEAETNCARMAAIEIDDYLRNGNINNSVNFPRVKLERSGVNRVCIIHKNIPGMLTNILPIFSKDNINIENMTNKSKGEYAYSIFDVNDVVDDQAYDELTNLEGVIKVRII